MKRLILTATAVLLSTLSVWGQVGTSTPDVATPGQTVLAAAHSQRHRNKRRGHRHHAQHHSGINARR
jgi:hypothetical protein